MTPEEREKIQADIQLALDEFPKVIRQKRLAYRHKERIMKPFMKMARKLQKEIEQRSKILEAGSPSGARDSYPSHTGTSEVGHEWRVCPLGSHLVKAHSRRGEGGKRIEVKAYCQKNRSRLDVLNAAEIFEISRIHFSDVKDRPCPQMYEFGERENVDLYIAGWVKYWNDVMKPSIALNPNVVKALIASESSFHNLKARPAGKGEGKVRGLMQVTDRTLSILGNHKGEIKNNLIDIKGDDLMEPNINICAGVRWLFQKRKLAESKLGDGVSWDQTVIFYKGYRNKPVDEIEKKMQPFRSFLEKLEKCQ